MYGKGLISSAEVKIEGQFLTGKGIVTLLSNVSIKPSTDSGNQKATL